MTTGGNPQTLTLVEIDEQLAFYAKTLKKATFTTRMVYCRKITELKAEKRSRPALPKPEAPKLDAENKLWCESMGRMQAEDFMETLRQQYAR